jgi:methylenetetrahydrofolate dehydrogenase (NADP+) / methenyltetrahydrofolate cyclohydrolase
MFKILDGKKLSEEILERLKKETASRQFKPTLAVVSVGDDPASKIFIRQKEKACNFVGAGFKFFNFPSNVSYEELKKEVVRISASPEFSGIVVQLPLPLKINAQEILNLIPPEKDVDVLSEKSLGKFYTNNYSVLPPVVGAISHFIEKQKISVRGKNVAIIGAGKLVGFPSSLWFFGQKATVSVLNEFTKNISAVIKNADIIVSGVGKPGLIKGNTVKRGAIIFDVGCGFKNNKISGDVDFKTVSKKAGLITPVPGGVGPMTVAVLMENLLKLNSK